MKRKGKTEKKGIQRKKGKRKENENRGKKRGFNLRRKVKEKGSEKIKVKIKNKNGKKGTRWHSPSILKKKKKKIYRKGHPPSQVLKLSMIFYKYLYQG